MMTTMAALLGALPLMLGHGTGSELRQPVGYSLVGGLLLSLALTRRRSSTSISIAPTSGFDFGSDPVTGTRKIRYASFKGTKRDAEIELARLVSQNAAGEGIDPSRATIDEFIERWHRDWATVNVGPKTAERYLQHLRLYVAPQIGAMRIQKLRPVHLSELYATLLRAGGPKGRGAFPPLCWSCPSSLHRALGHAATWGIVAQNVAALVSPLPVPDAEIASLTEEQIGATLRHLEGRTLRPIVSFLLGTGARRGEALALRWKDLDFDKGVVRIERSLEQTKGAQGSLLRFKSPKTKNGRRYVSISPWLVAELKAHRTRQQERRLSLGMGRAPDDSLIFARWDGSTPSPHWLTQKFALAMDALKIDCTLHGLRHTHVSQLIAAGMDVLTISRRIGHASAAITLRVYGYLFRKTDARAAEIMEATFARVRTN